MDEVIAGLERFTFTLEKDVEMQKGTGLLPFQGMDSECPWWQRPSGDPHHPSTPPPACSADLSAQHPSGD